MTVFWGHKSPKVRYDFFYREVDKMSALGKADFVDMR